VDVAPVAVLEEAPVVRRYVQPIETHTPALDVSIVDTIARRVVVPAALVLDVATTLIRIAETTMQIVLPEASAAFEQHRSPVLAALFYSSALIVILGISIGVTASLFLSMPLLYQINRRIDSAVKIRDRRLRKDMVDHLRDKRARYKWYVVAACSVPVLFGMSYFLASFHIGALTWVTAVADIAAPIVVLFVITQTEREQHDIDPQEVAVEAATSVVLGNLRSIRQTDGGMLTQPQAATLKAGTSGDIEGMIDASTPHDDTDRYYTLTDVCHKLNVSADRESADRKKVYRIVGQAYKTGEAGIRRASKGRGFLVPGKLLDQLFGDFQPVNKSAVKPN
jgi:hypothetical protein